MATSRTVTRRIDASDLMVWRVNIPDMFKQIISNHETAIFTVPLQITAGLLGQVAARASELNDPKLNALMCRLALYDCADPYSPGYDKTLTEKTLRAGNTGKPPNRTKGTR